MKLTKLFVVPGVHAVHMGAIPLAGFSVKLWTVKGTLQLQAA